MPPGLETPSLKLIFISHRSILALMLGVFVLLVGLFGVYVILSTASLGSLQLSSGNLVVFGFVGILFLLAAYQLWDFSKTKRVEFYENKIRVFVGGHEKTVDYSYSELQLGAAKLRFVRTASTLHFKIVLNNGRKRVSLDIQDGRIKEQNLDIYSWLQSKLSNRK